jgi:hypothetical protein
MDRLELALYARDHGLRSYGCDEFPTVFEHAIPLMDYEYGGPLVVLSGNVIGVAIARVGNHGGLANPGDVLRRQLPDLLSGKLAENWKGTPQLNQPK